MTFSCREGLPLSTVRAVQPLARLVTVLTLLIALAISSSVLRGETNAVNPATNAEPDPQLLRSLLLVQEQLRATQRAVEQAREEAQTESKRATETMTERLSLIEKTMNAERQREFDTLLTSTRLMLVAVGAIACLGFFAILFTGWFQIRAMTRLSDLSQQLRVALPPPSHFAELGAGDAMVGQTESVERSNANLLSAIDRLQIRIDELENVASRKGSVTSNGHKELPAGETALSGSKVAMILGKGQVLLNLEKPDEALAHFDEALAIDPKNVEAWIKKGAALERLQRIDEAIEAYDEAIATDNSTATAYLFKAGVYQSPEAL
jgi:tetratricopeptide (TPR) repeat protein